MPNVLKLSRESWRWTLHLVETVLLVAVSASMLWWIFWGPQSDRSRQAASRQRPAGALPAQPISLKGTWPAGDIGAPVVVVVYSDYECPACRKAAEGALPALKRDFVNTGQVQIVYKHLPLVRIHPFAMGAAIAAECAGAQGQFWAMHESLILGPLELDIASLQRRARLFGLRAREFGDCLDGESVKKTVEEETRIATRIGIDRTPVFIVGLLQRDRTVNAIKRIDGVGAYEDLRTAVGDVLAGVSGR